MADENVIREWLRNILGLEKAVKKQAEAVAQEKVYADKQEAAKQEVIKQTQDVEERVARLRRQAEVIQHDYPQFRINE